MCVYVCVYVCVSVCVCMCVRIILFMSGFCFFVIQRPASDNNLNAFSGISLCRTRSVYGFRHVHRLVHRSHLSTHFYL